MSLSDAYNMPTFRRKVFINNFNYFKEEEKRIMENQTSASQNPQKSPKLLEKMKNDAKKRSSKLNVK